MYARFAAITVFAALSLPAAASSAVDAGNTFRFGNAPQRAMVGQLTAVSVVVRPTGVLCAASVRYADSTVQKLTSVRARAGKASWRWRVPARVKPGSATVNIGCGRAGKGVRRFVVSTPVAPDRARITIRNSGFSQRVRSTSRYVSYGIEVVNQSPENDALDVTVLVNFLDATGRVVDTDSTQVPAVGANSVFYLGGSTTIPDASPVAKIEIVHRVGGQSPKRKLGPVFADIIVQAQKADPAWVGAVVGQIENDHPTHLMTRTSISTVIYDSGGAIIGGSTGRMSEELLPGVRAYFQAAAGANSIPFERAFSPSVSTLATYQATA